MWGYKHRDPAIHSRVRDQAAWLIRDHGDNAEDVLRAKMNRSNITKDDAYRFKLTMEELERQRKQGPRRSRHRGSLLQRILARLGLNRPSHGS
ncbi:hypothetical protein [Sphingomonas sanxanigenens]|uniref:Uncharacterized protein n=1 Tax=Sphingomonas sanxanigenens DSM 19645 = NX02 TaxID=1123269 RepID=W0AGP9_9SPHN|nr:hypothetical protein [Sphingomonas sanxanigenens]AHE56301.1 hypothetical protein NX02_23430 [Sphingomonas sanxanigenens DSM 19645 = NX02]